MNDEASKTPARSPRAAKKTTRSRNADISASPTVRTEDPALPVERASELADKRPAPSNQADGADGLESEIRRRAYELYLARGGQSGDDLSDWLEAERLVRRQRGNGQSDSADTLA